MIDLDVRIDTVTWEAPLRHPYDGPFPRHRVRGIDATTGEVLSTTDFLGNLDLPGAVQLKLKTRGSRKVLEFSGSLPQVLDGHNIFPVRVMECFHAMSLVEQAVSMDGLTPFTQSRRVTRVDLVRDFWPVQNGAGLINSIANDPNYRRTSTDRYTTGRGASSGTIYRGPKEAQSVLYDKPSAVRATYRKLGPVSRQELIGMASGRVRYELRLTQDQLRQHVGISLTDIDDDRLLAELHRRFTEAHFDRAGLRVNEFAQLLSQSDLSPARKMSVLGDEIFKMYNIDVGVSTNTRDRNRADLRDIGIGIDHLEHLVQPARLDFCTGTTVPISPHRQDQDAYIGL